MGVFKTADGRSLVGIGQQDGNEYSGFAGWRDCVIQLTASGATENSVKYLNAIKDYAIAHNAKGESIMPPNLSIWISNNGVTTAVQADDIAVDGANVTICGIKWNGTAWDYTDAGKGGGGGGSDLDGKIVIEDTPTVGNFLVANDDGVFVPQAMLPHSLLLEQSESGWWMASADENSEVVLPIYSINPMDTVYVIPQNGDPFAGVVASTEGLDGFRVVGWSMTDATAGPPALKVYTLTISNAPAGAPAKAFALSWTSKPLPQDPLVVTLTPSSAQSPLSGTWTGATWAEIQDALETGREIIGVMPGYSRVNMTASIAANQSMTPNAYYVFYVGGTTPTFVNSFLDSDGTYNSQVFLLTPASD